MARLIEGGGVKARSEWLAAMLPLGLTAAMVAAGLGGWLTWVFTPVALTVGLWLYERAPSRGFLRFCYVLWMVAPFVRRLADWQGGRHDLNPIMLAPALVTGLGLLSALRAGPQLFGRGFLPFSVAALACLYGGALGLSQGLGAAALFGLLNALAPVALAIHILVLRRDADHAAAAVFNTLAWGGMAMGAYAVLQYLSPPPWDVAWMRTAEIASIGRPEPLQVRVFGTMNAPGPFAVMMSACVLAMLAGAGGRARWLGGLAGGAALVLSLVRSAWGGLIVGVGVLAALGSARRRLRYLAAGGALLVVGTALLAFGPGEGVRSRIGGLARLDQDVSLQQRATFHAEMTMEVLANPVGRGLGGTGVATRLSTEGAELGARGSFDSGILDLLFTYGWAGAVMLAAVVAIAVGALRSGGSGAGAQLAAAIVIETTVQLLFFNVLGGATGMLVFPVAALALALADPECGARA
ncbi:hypothetical protein [Brevundimonas sp. PAMC22021]|uniref:hypothetical protein n=1 Tax=Brevundimonas sp. PAMC22021 TaxID=2861285 RepID=UPI001C6324B8|nr:hypothetical protein [Brevundimonas sp. PAMC22021]QYF87654.1 hypothetical protein KY493_03905 [Brevundimonas sp. PAMC22021]